MSLVESFGSISKRALSAVFKASDALYGTLAVNRTLLDLTGKVLDRQGELRRSYLQSLGDLHRAMGVPTRDDLSDVAALVRQVDAKLTDLELDMAELKRSLRARGEGEA